MRIRGIIFDLNGVLVDDEPVHFRGFQQALEEEGMTLSWEEYCEKYLPYDDRNFFLHFLSDQNRESNLQPVNQLIDRKSHHYFKAIERHVPMIEPSVEFVRKLSPKVLLAIASGAAKKEIEFILGQLGLLKRFAAIVSAADVVNGKPHPEAFLKALAGLKGQDPTLKRDEVIVIEDSYRAIRSVHMVGMKCVALATTYPTGELGEADLVLEDLAGWTLQRLEEQLSQ